MQERTRTYGKIFLTVSSLGALFVLAETVMQFFGKSICPTEGCRIAAQYARYGDISVLLIGFFVFFLLALFSALSLSRGKTSLDRYSNYVLIASLASEGFFTGYQAFSIRTPCLLCLIIFGLLAVLGVIRLLAGEKALIAGFASLAAVFSLMYLVPPTTATVTFPENERLILFYSRDCKHCSEIMHDIGKSGMAVKRVEVDGYSGLLKSMGIKEVPTLLVSEPSQKIFLTGTEAIRRYLSACAQAKQAEGKPAAKRKSEQAGKNAGADLTFDIFTQQGILSRPGETATVTGACKEEEVCK